MTKMTARNEQLLKRIQRERKLHNELVTFMRVSTERNCAREATLKRRVRGARSPKEERQVLNEMGKIHHRNRKNSSQKSSWPKRKHEIEDSSSEEETKREAKRKEQL